MSIFINGIFPGELTPSETIGGCINIFENVWPSPSDTISKLEQEINKHDSNIYWQRAETIGLGVHQTARTNDLLQVTNLASLTNNGLLQNIHNQFNMILLATTIPYVNRYNIQEPLFHEPYEILRYRPGTEYKSHYDGSTKTGRIISALCYLNDDYEGGEIEFVNFKVKIKPQPGMLILFPSNYAYMHIAHPITAGTKYSLVTWIRDRDN